MIAASGDSAIPCRRFEGSNPRPCLPRERIDCAVSSNGKMDFQVITEEYERRLSLSSRREPIFSFRNALRRW
jgi:hypothetical protein